VEPQDTPRTTVVVATRDRCAELGRTLRRLRALRPRPPVVVVDNDSTDGTTAYVRSAHPEVRVVRLRRNRGAAARNVGVALAATPYVAFSDDDSWWADGALETAADAFDTDPRLGLVAAATLVGPDDRPDPVNALLAAGLDSGPGDLPGPRVLGFLACAAVVRADAFRAVGGFSDVLEFIGEEALLAQDLAAAGWELCHLPEVVAHHHPSATRPPSAWRRRRELRNALLVDLMRRPPGRAARSAARLARDAATAPEARGALAEALRAAPAALARRRPLPAGVERDLRRLEDA
jgi:GT2 family glycosyltransferase